VVGPERIGSLKLRRLMVELDPIRSGPVEVGPATSRVILGLQVVRAPFRSIWALRSDLLGPRIRSLWAALRDSPFIGLLL
jgi:hypothetical protein